MLFATCFAMFVQHLPFSHHCAVRDGDEDLVSSLCRTLVYSVYLVYPAGSFPEVQSEVDSKHIRLG